MDPSSFLITSTAFSPENSFCASLQGLVSYKIMNLTQDEIEGKGYLDNIVIIFKHTILCSTNSEAFERQFIL